VTGGDGFAPVAADMGQGDDRPGVDTGGEGGAQCDEFRRETVHRLEWIPQTDHFVKDVFDPFLQSVDLWVILSILGNFLQSVGSYFSCQRGHPNAGHRRRC